jgi:2-polyprenyl-3-methyl-5-hydroxy-6-metoxy-1,4-benzoquinol methylase/acyl carrier protein
MRSEGSEAALRTCVARYLGNCNPDRIPHAAFDDLGLDSLQAIQLCQDLARQFHLTTSPNALILSSLDHLLGLVDNAPKESSTQKPLPNDKRAASRHPLDAYQKLLDLIADAAQAEKAELQPQHTLQQLGLDASSVLHLCQDIQHAFMAAPEFEQISMQTTIQDFASRLGIEPEADSLGAESASRSLGLEQGFASTSLAALERTDTSFARAANQRGFAGYWTSVAPLFDELLLAYILQGLQTLGLDLTHVPPGTVISETLHVTKYDRLFERLWDFLKKREILVQTRHHIVRSNTPQQYLDAKQLSASLVVRYPCYEPETKLLELIGPHFAACVVGDLDPISVLFGTPEALHIVQNFYASSPMMSTLTDQLLKFFTFVLDDKQKSPDRASPVRILEVGAGTGGTTVRLAEALASLGIMVQYTFTDVSPGFVSQAKRRFKQFPWMDYAVLNLEQEVSDNFRSRFDIVMGANVVHATVDRTATCRRLKEMLKPSGFIVLSEITHPIAWYDICFGLLDGWWLAEGGKGYPIQSAEAWMTTFRRAGFAATGYSKGATLEANSQQLLVGCNTVGDVK